MNISRKPLLRADIELRTNLATLRIGGFDDLFIQQGQLFLLLSENNIELEGFYQSCSRLSEVGEKELLLLFNLKYSQAIVTTVEQFIEKSEKNSCRIMQGTKSVAKLGFKDVEKGNHLTTLRYLLACFGKEQVKVDLCSTSNGLSTLLFDSNELAKIHGILNEEFILSDYYAKNCQGV